MATDATSILDSSLASGSITFTGLGSGTDFGTVVEQLVEVESIYKYRLEEWKSTWEAKVEAIETLNSRMLALEEAASAIKTESGLMTRAASSSDTTVAYGIASSSAAIGTYNVTVGEDVIQILSTAGKADADTTAYGGAGGTLTLVSNGVTYNVAIGAADTLQDIADSINGVTGAAIVASVEDDGTSSNPYHLVLTSGVGGNAGRISVTNNPTDISFDSKDMAISDTSSWGGSSVSVVGQFSGDKSVASVYTYTFTVANSGNPSTIGTDSFDINWTASAGGGSGTITVPADYQVGDSIEVENGIFIQLDSGTVNDADSFTVRAFANDIDDAETGTWSGPAITTSGNYSGTINKTYSFEVISEGDIQGGGGADTVVLRWTDSLGNTGTISIDDSDLSYEVEDGFEIKIDAGTLTSGDDFQVNVFAPVKQQGQDIGLAQGAKLVHEGFADTSISPVTTSDSTFTYTYGGEAVSVDVPADTVLLDLVDLINNAADNPGVEASIINDGQGLPNSYKLVLTGTETGAEYQFTSVDHTFTGTSFSNGGDAGGGFTVTQLATNAMIQVDGYPSGDVFLQRESNTVSDVITGVSLSLGDGGSTRITVSVDIDSVASKIDAFVNAVNYVQDYIRETTKYSADEDEKGILIGNYGFQITKSQIDRILNQSVPGLVDGDATYTLLSQIGIESDPDDEGRWVVSSTALFEALAEDPDAVVALFVSNDNIGSEGVANRMYDLMDAQTNDETGVCNILIENYNEIIENIDKKIENEEARLALFEQRQLERFARLEATLNTLNKQSEAIDSAIEQLPDAGGK